MDARMAALCADYNEAKGLVYGLSVSDYLLLREQCAREAHIPQAVYCIPSSDPKTEDVPAIAREPAHIMPQVSIKKAGNVRPLPSRTERTQQSELDILKSLGE